LIRGGLEQQKTIKKEKSSTSEANIVEINTIKIDGYIKRKRSTTHFILLRYFNCDYLSIYLTSIIIITIIIFWLCMCLVVEDLKGAINKNIMGTRATFF
jgi:hypothetical protein